jgi:hypothetical protein
MLYVLLGLLLAHVAYAEKRMVHWVNATTNTDGSVLTNLAAVRVEWGSCLNGAMAIVQASILVNAPATSTPIYPSHLNPFCVRAYSRTSDGTESLPTPVVVVSSLGELGTPIVLGQSALLSPAAKQAAAKSPVSPSAKSPVSPAPPKPAPPK